MCSRFQVSTEKFHEPAFHPTAGPHHKSFWVSRSTVDVVRRCHGFHCLLFLRLVNFCCLFAMALALGNRAGRIFGLRRAVFGSWLQSQLSTSAILSQTSKSPSESDSKIYEMRTYYVKPKAFGKQKKNNGLTILFVLFQGKYPTSLNWCWWSSFPSPPLPHLFSRCGVVGGGGGHLPLGSLHLRSSSLFTD